MSAPPQIIQVKRKRTEEGAVPFLRIEGVNKRRRSDNFVYQRRAASAAAAADAGRHTPRSLKPVIHSSRPGDEPPPGRIVRTTPASPIRETSEDAPDSARPSEKAEEDEATPRDGVPTTPKHHLRTAEPRRFHMSRAAMSPSHVIPKGVGKRSRYSSPAVFVERSRKRKVEEAIEQGLLGEAAASRAPPGGEAMEADRPRRPKRPGTGSRTAPKPSLPPSMRNRWNVDMDQLAQEMNDYTLQQLSANVSWIEEQAKRYEPRKSAPRPSPSELTGPASPQQLKFKPKAPARRLAERQPEVVAAEEAKLQQNAQQQDVDMGDDASDDDDDDYIIETYVRVPATTLGAAVPPEKIGLLVFDTEPDQEFFYGQEHDSEDELDEDEEDENAENYYTADYPDDEVASDDEYDRDPYHFRTGNASDMEEYGEEDDRYNVDDEKEDDGLNEFRAYLGGKPPPPAAGF